MLPKLVSLMKNANSSYPKHLQSILLTRLYVNDSKKPYPSFTRKHIDLLKIVISTGFNIHEQDRTMEVDWTVVAESLQTFSPCLPSPAPLLILFKIIFPRSSSMTFC